MKSSVRAFLEGIIDYAGLFPPAGLSLDTSIHFYRDYRESEDAWMLARYIIPASRLRELRAYDEELFSRNPPYGFSVLGKATETASEYRRELKQFVNQLQAFQSFHHGHVSSDVLELKLPREAVLGHDGDLLVAIIEETAKSLQEGDVTPEAIFWEARLEESWKKDIQHVLRVLQQYNEQNNNSEIRFGFKQRCGGLEASMFPTPEQLAHVLHLTKEYEISLKCTAGLHHPVRHYAHSVKTKMHGFFNVFGGAMLHHEHDLPREQLLRVLKEEDQDHFRFTEDGFHWNDLSVSTDSIQELRRHKLISFGSCSFDEPREDLRELGLI